MINNYDHKKLIKTALCTSPLIAVMAVAPIAIVEPFKTSFILAAIAGFTLVVLFVWAVNWGLFYLVETYSYQEGTNNLQYVFSYLLTFMFVFIAERYFKSSFILAAIAGSTLVVLFMWAANWGLFYLVETYSYQEGTNQLQYVFSYLLSFMFVFIAESYFEPNGLEMNTFLTDPGWAIIF